MKDDLISRQAAIDAIKAYLTFADWEPSVQRILEMSVNDTTDMLERLPSVQSEHNWIPVSERLPENSGRYLVTRGLNAAGNLWNRVYIVNYSDLMGLKKEKIFWIGNVGKNDFERIQDVVAWQPLPEPYEGEEE